MRIYCCLMLLLATASVSYAQMEPCLAGVNSPGCGIQITMNPPVKAADGNKLWVPNEITIDVPVRLHATKVQLNSGPTGSQSANDFKLLAETIHYKKAGGITRFKLELKTCPGADTAFDIAITAPKLPYPIAVDYNLECKQASADAGYPPPTK